MRTKTLCLTIVGLALALVAPGQSLHAADATKLHSNAKATNKLYLDFDGHTGPAFGIGPVVTTPAFEVPAAIPEIHSGVAVYFAPFNLDVTTEEPNGGRVAIVHIGGKWSDWNEQRGRVGGTSIPNGFKLGMPDAYAFAVNSLENNTRHVIRTIAHEAGHVFGLQHQTQWDAIMGPGLLEAPEVSWVSGVNEAGTRQDDVAILTATLGLAQTPPAPPVVPPAAAALSLAIVGDPNSGQPYNIVASGVPPGTYIVQWSIDGVYFADTSIIHDRAHDFGGRVQPLGLYGKGNHAMKAEAKAKDGRLLASGSITWTEAATVTPPVVVTPQDSAEVVLGGVTYTITRKGK